MACCSTTCPRRWCHGASTACARAATPRSMPTSTVRSRIAIGTQTSLARTSSTTRSSPPTRLSSRAVATRTTSPSSASAGRHVIATAPWPRSPTPGSTASRSWATRRTFGHTCRPTSTTESTSHSSSRCRGVKTAGPRSAKRCARSPDSKLLRQLWSAAGEARLAGTVLEERLHAGARVLRAEDFHERLAFEVETVVERTPETIVDHPLRQAHRDDRAVTQLTRPMQRRVFDLVRRNDAIDQSDRVGFFGAQLTATPHDLLGARRADESRQPLGASRARNDAEKDLGLAEAG